jgi:hypothetical protein
LFNHLSGHLAEDFSEVVAVNAAGDCQGKSTGFKDQAPEEKMPEISLVPPKETDVKHRF